MSTLIDLVAGDLQPWEVAFILGAAFLSGVFHTFSGFAGGVVLSIAIAPVLGVVAVVPMLSVALIISASSRIWVFRRDIDLPVYANVMLPALPGIVIGALIYTRLDPSAISILLGAVLLFTALMRRHLERVGLSIGRVTLAAAGCAFGLISGMTIGGGLLLVPFLLGAGLRRERLAALFAGIGFALNVSKALVFAATSTLDLHMLLLGIVVGLCTIPGTYVGYALLRATGIRVHTLYMEAFVVLAGLGYLAHGLL